MIFGVIVTYNTGQPTNRAFAMNRKLHITLIVLLTSSVLVLGLFAASSAMLPVGDVVTAQSSHGFTAPAKADAAQVAHEPAFAARVEAIALPIDPPADWQPKGLIAKLEAGADFVQTQFCMDLGIVRRYVQRLLDLGIAQKLPMLIGVCPIPSAKSARWMKEKLFGTIIPDAIVTRLEQAADSKAEGMKICIEQLQELATIPGVGGAHVMAPVNPSVVPEVISTAGVNGQPRA